MFLVMYLGRIGQEDVCFCVYFEIISDLWFSNVFCDGWVIIATFSWRQSRNHLNILLLAMADFIISQGILGMMSLSFGFRMSADNVIVFEYFLFLKC